MPAALESRLVHSPDAPGLPGVRGRSPKSVLVDLAYDEYCDRLEANEDVSLEEHCARFPQFRSSLRRVLEAHHYVHALGQSAPATPAAGWPEPGESFQGCELERELGRGTFGHVFLARQPALGDRLVVAKVTSRESKEAALLGRLNHRHIVPVLSVQQAAPFSLLCMPYLGVATLCDVADHAFSQGVCSRSAQVILDAARADLPAEHRTAETEPVDALLQTGTYVQGIARLGARLAEALAVAHQQGIYHRDIKPSNVLVTPSGRPMLLDFNLSQEHSDADRRMGGTPAYMAPEQLAWLRAPRDEREPLRVDGRADIFALGLVLYELLAGRSPFGPLLPIQSHGEVIGYEWPRAQALPLRVFNPDAPAALEQAILKCLARDPAQRWSSAADLARALEDCAQGPVRRRRRWRRAGGLTAATLLLGAALGVGLWLADRPPPVDPLEQRARDAEQHFRRGLELVRLERFADAYAELEKADKLSLRPNPRSHVLMGYCAVHKPMIDHEKAVYHYKQALDLGYPQDARVLNNIGFSLMQSGRHLHAFPYLKQATELDPTLDAAWFNTGMHALSTLREQKNRRLKLLPERIQNAADLFEKAIALQSTAERHLFAGFTYALAAEQLPEQAAKAIGHFAMSLKLGQDPETIRGHPVLAHLHARADFQALFAPPMPATTPVKRRGYVAPWELAANR